MRKPRLRKIEWLPLGHTAGRWQSQDPAPGLPDSKGRSAAPARPEPKAQVDTLTFVLQGQPPVLVGVGGRSGGWGGGGGGGDNLPESFLR